MTYNPVLNSILPSMIPKLGSNSLIALLIPRMPPGLHPFQDRNLVGATLNTRLNVSTFNFPPAVRYQMDTCLYWVHKCLGDREAELAG